MRALYAQQHRKLAHASALPLACQKLTVRETPLPPAKYAPARRQEAALNVRTAAVAARALQRASDRTRRLQNARSTAARVANGRLAGLKWVARIMNHSRDANNRALQGMVIAC
jgi:hypothetical protein